MDGRASHDLPLLEAKDAAAASVFQPTNLLREARRQRGLVDKPVPAVCVLDPDGDIVRHLRRGDAAERHPGWACYHTEMWVTRLAGIEIGIVGCAVGAPFAVVVAEQMFASGCRFLISVTSAGQLAEIGPTPYFILIDRALRDEGTSYHYLAPSRFAEAPPRLLAAVAPALSTLPQPVHRGAVWTTDAPYRETAAAVAARKAEGLLAVEMEAAALYALARAKGVPLICFAHVTNCMARDEGDFEKGAADGALDALALIAAAAPAGLAAS